MSCATDEATYVYVCAGDDPVNDSDPSGQFTLGVCGQLAAQLAVIGGFGGTGSVCLVRTMFTPDGNDDIGFTETVGIIPAGFGASGGVGLELEVSNANHLDDLRRWFQAVSIDVSIGPGFGVGVNAGGFWGKGTEGQTVWGLEGGIGLGAGYGGYLYQTITWVQQVHNPILAWILKHIWGEWVPGADQKKSTIESVLANTWSQIQAAQSRGKCS
jgi:hypothetical protein